MPEISADQLHNLIRRELYNKGSLSRDQIAMDLGLVTDEGLAILDQLIEDLIREGTCERRPDPGQPYLLAAEQPVGIRRPRLFRGRT